MPLICAPPAFAIGSAGSTRFGDSLIAWIPLSVNLSSVTYVGIVILLLALVSTTVRLKADTTYGALAILIIVSLLTAWFALLLSRCYRTASVQDGVKCCYHSSHNQESHCPRFVAAPHQQF